MHKCDADASRIVGGIPPVTEQVDQPTLQSLIGAVQDAHADHGVLVSWGGFKRTVDARRNELFFRIRLWRRTQIIDALLDIYERLPEEFRAELALRRIWTLVPDDEQEAP